MIILALPLIIWIGSIFDDEYQTTQTQTTQTTKTAKATIAKATQTTQKKRHISLESISKIKACLSGRPINTLWEFEHSKYYKIMQFEKYPISSTEIGYHSPSRNVMVGLKLWNDKIIESSLHIFKTNYLTLAHLLAMYSFLLQALQVFTHTMRLKIWLAKLVTA